jgi:3-deoxy-alpha-D-manno-octulosonate 8-oxidase
MSKVLVDPLPGFGTVVQSLVPEVVVAPSCGFAEVAQRIGQRRVFSRAEGIERFAVFLIDDHFNASENSLLLGADFDDLVLSVTTEQEPSTDSVDSLTDQVRGHSAELPFAVVGLGGGITMDSTKAVSNLLTNGRFAEDFQGWDLLRVPGVHKIGIPTISGTGSESSRTCVISNHRTGVKLGMNSKFSLFDAIVLDPELTESVPRNQFFFTGMDTYMHCIESLNGRYRNAFADALSREALNLVNGVFRSKDMLSFEQRLNLMTASCLGGMAIAGSYVGLIHPMSAALSIELGIHHGVANCMVMRAMKAYYPHEYEEFWVMADLQQIDIPSINGSSMAQEQLDRLAAATMVHERPLSNALGLDYQVILGGGRLQELFAML